MKKSFFVAASLALLTVGAQAQPLPVRADAPFLFAPRGWKVEKQINGYVNRDKSLDKVLVLVENKVPKDANGDPTARRRALVVLLREGKGWDRVGFSNQLLLGTRDGGAFYGVVETPVSVKIVRAGIIVEMEAGSREVTNSTIRLRYIPAKKGVYLIGRDSVTNDRLTANVVSTSSNFLTGVKKVTTLDSKDRKTTKTSHVSKQLRSLESLREEDRYDE